MIAVGRAGGGELLVLGPCFQRVYSVSNTSVNFEETKMDVVCSRTADVFRALMTHAQAGSEAVEEIPAPGRETREPSLHPRAAAESGRDKKKTRLAGTNMAGGRSSSGIYRKKIYHHGVRGAGRFMVPLFSMANPAKWRR